MGRKTWKELNKDLDRPREEPCEGRGPNPMSIKNDFIMDQVMRFIEMIMIAMERARQGRGAEAVGAYEEVVGQALDMDANALLMLSPESLATVASISAADQGLAEYAAWSLLRAADIYEPDDPQTAEVRRGQARALAGLWGFDPEVMPEGLAQATEGLAQATEGQGA